MRLAPIVLAVAAVFVAAVPAIADPGAVQSKRAEARQVLGEIQSLDSRLEHAVEAYNLANIKLARIERDVKENARALVVARSNLSHAQAALQARLVALYTSGDSNSALEVLLGSKSLDDLLNRLDAVNRVSDQDTRILTEVSAFRHEVQRRAGVLKSRRAQQAQVVAARRAYRSSIQSQLAARHRLLASIKSEIVRLQAEERARQAALVRAARARAAAQRAISAHVDTQNVVGVAAETPEGASVAPPSQYGGVVGIAMRYLGTPYVWGGASPAGFDCSGFVMYVYAQVGVSLPHNAAAQYGYGTPVSKDQLQPGDLVFFDGLGHEGIYVGGGSFIHSPHTGDVVKISSLSDSWYASTYVGARRL
jgi:cell wall-associated NlpC family hydrolase